MTAEEIAELINDGNSDHIFVNAADKALAMRGKMKASDTQVIYRATDNRDRVYILSIHIRGFVDERELPRVLREDLDKEHETDAPHKRIDVRYIGPENPDILTREIDAWIQDYFNGLSTLNEKRDAYANAMRITQSRLDHFHPNLEMSHVSRLT